MPISRWCYQMGTVSLIGMMTIIAIETGRTPSSQAAMLANWRFDPAANQLEVTLQERTTPRYFLLAQPTRIVLDLPNTQLNKVASQQNYPGAVRQVRVSQFEKDVARIVLELSPEVVLAPGLVQLQRLQPQGGKGDRWLLRPLIADQITPAQTQKLPPPLPSTLPPVTINTQQATGTSVPPLNPAPVNPVTPSTGTPPNPTLPPASFGNQQPPVVSVPPLLTPNRGDPEELPSNTSSTRSSSQPTGISEPYSKPVISFGQPLPKATPEVRATPLSSLPRLQPSAPILPGETSTNSITAATASVVVASDNGTYENILLPVGTQLSLRYVGEAALSLKTDSPQQAELLLEEDVRDRTGKAIAPAGTPVIGRFETDGDGNRFIAQAIALPNRNIPLAAQSEILDGDRTTSKPATLQPGQILQIRLTEALSKF